MKKLSGIIAAPFTPFHADGSLNLSRVPTLANALISQGASGAFVCGTTGEGSSLSTDERKKVAEQWIGTAGQLAVVVHVGHNSIAESKELASHAARHGATAIAAHPPSFIRPGNIEALIKTCAEIAAAAPDTPFYYYHIPSMAGSGFNMADFLELAADRIPSLAGVKFTHENLMDYGCARNVRAGKFEILFGRDEILLAGLALGANGAVGSTYNYASRLYNDIIARYHAGDLSSARELQLRSMRFIMTFLRYGDGINAGKAIMRMCGVDCGPVRLPHADLSPEAYGKLETELRQQGFFDFALSAADVK